jgi:hypothetical protein
MLEVAIIACLIFFSKPVRRIRGEGRTFNMPIACQ